MPGTDVTKVVGFNPAADTTVRL